MPSATSPPESDSKPPGDPSELRLPAMGEADPGDDESEKFLQSASANPPGHAAQRSRRFTAEQFTRWQALYNKQWRQLRRWIERGDACSDPCPLDDPARMPGWWDRRMKWRVPPEIEAAALAAAKALPPPPDAVAPALPATQEQPPPSPAGLKPIDIESFDPEEGDRLRELKQIQAAKYAELRDAYSAGIECSARETKYLKLCETVDKIETRVTGRLKKRGLYILRAAVERDLAAAAELLCRSRDSMVRRILELCPSLVGEQRAEVTAAIERARASEERMLSRLESLTATDLLRELAA